MRKIAIIGAGSLVFSTTLMNDLLSTPSLSSSIFVLMDIDLAKARRLEGYLRQIIGKQHLKADVVATSDRSEALRDADYVITTFQIGGVGAWKVDYEVPTKYGIDVCVGCCVGPGGVFRALRTIPIMLDIAKEMEAQCPKAHMLNYVNPMAMVCMSIGLRTKISYVGLCHGVQTTLDLISRYVGVRKEEIDFLAAGINHMAWFLKLEMNGKDLYPILRANLERPEYYVNEKVRAEVARHFGYFMTESSGHLSDYLPWFRKNRNALDTYCDQPGLAGETGFSYAFAKTMDRIFGASDYLKLESGNLSPRSVDYCSYILEALEVGKCFRFQGNVTNKCYINNLPRDCCVEVPVFADRNGLHPTPIGDLPPQLAAMNQSNITLQQLGVEAALTGDPELVVAAIAMDPLTSAVLTLKEIRDMTIEMFEGEAKYLPQFRNAKPRKIYAVNIPPDTKGVDVPLDPSLAVANRFGKLSVTE